MADLVAATAAARGPAQIRGKLAERVRNVPATVLALDASDPGELGLTPEQVQRLRSAADSLAPRVEAALDMLSAAFGARGPMTAARRARMQEGAQSAEAILEAGVRLSKAILRDDQWAKLPVWLVSPASAEDLRKPPRFEIPIGNP
jgi:hypothetical protein